MNASFDLLPVVREADDATADSVIRSIIQSTSSKGAAFAMAGWQVQTTSGDTNEEDLRWVSGPCKPGEASVHVIGGTQLR